LCRVTCVDGEIAIVNFLGAKRWERKNKKSKKQKSETAHKSMYVPLKLSKREIGRNLVSLVVALSRAETVFGGEADRFQRLATTGR
jgi:hypothetical protein